MRQSFLEIRRQSTQTRLRHVSTQEFGSRSLPRVALGILEWIAYWYHGSDAIFEQSCLGWVPWVVFPHYETPLAMLRKFKRFFRAFLLHEIVFFRACPCLLAS